MGLRSESLQRRDREKDHEGAADQRIGKSRAGPPTQAAHPSDTPVILDVRAPPHLDTGAELIEGSVLDRSKLTEMLRGCDGIVHIAAWHGIHEDRGEKDAYDFVDLNVRGTFEVFEAAAGVGKVIYVSTTSVYRPDTRYASSKILAELIAEDYRKHRLMKVVTLRARGFIPYWDRTVSTKYSDWARWFWKGAVNIDDVAAAVILSLDLLSRRQLTGNSSSRQDIDADLDVALLALLVVDGDRRCHVLSDKTVCLCLGDDGLEAADQLARGEPGGGVQQVSAERGPHRRGQLDLFVLACCRV